MIGGLTHETQSLQRLEHLDPHRTDPQIGPITERTGGAHDELLVAEPHRDEGISRAEIGILTKTENRHPPAVEVEGVEVIAVVEVAVTRRRVGDPIGRLMNGEVVPRRHCHARTLWAGRSPAKDPT